MATNNSSHREKFKQVLEQTQKEISHLRTGKASVQLLDEVAVEVYGSRMKVSEVATISVPDTSLLVITPWDKNILPDIEKAIVASQLNLSPVVDGEIVRVPVPSLTTERRQEMVKILHQKAELGRVMTRSVRTDVKKEVEAQKGEPGVSEDDIKYQLEELEEITKEFIEKIDQTVEKKEKELLTI